MERRNDERDRLRQACKDELAELLDMDEDEVSEVAAEAAARTVRALSQPDSDQPPKRKPHVVALLAALTALLGTLATLASTLQSCR